MELTWNAIMGVIAATLALISAAWALPRFVRLLLKMRQIISDGKDLLVSMSTPMSSLEAAEARCQAILSSFGSDHVTSAEQLDEAINSLDDAIAQCSEKCNQYDFLWSKVSTSGVKESIWRHCQCDLDRRNRLMKKRMGTSATLVSAMRALAKRQEPDTSLPRYPAPSYGNPRPIIAAHADHPGNVGYEYGLPQYTDRHGRIVDPCQPAAAPRSLKTKRIIVGSAGAGAVAGIPLGPIGAAVGAGFGAAFGTVVTQLRKEKYQKK